MIKNKFSSLVLICFLSFLLIFLAGFNPYIFSKNSLDNLPAASSKLVVHFIDVWQGDASLIQIPGNINILIDGGSRVKGPRVVSYLKSLGIKKLNIVIGTHPHEDHIGGLINVINAFEVDNVIDSGVSHTSYTYKRYLQAIAKKNINFLIPPVGESYKLNDDTELLICGPHKKNSNDLNNSSVVAKLKYKDISFLFTGDAEKKQENQLLASGLDLSSTVLKVGHHGSKSSSTKNFLKKVNPIISIISVGASNAYGHPSQTVIDNLLSVGSTVYRTDTTGNIVIETDGISLNVVKGTPFVSSITTTEAATSSTASFVAVESTTTTTIQEQQSQGAFVGSKKSDVYHYPNCGSAKNIKPENLITFNSVEEAKNAGYRPCKNCKPPG